jgi:hypothetical protein
MSQLKPRSSTEQQPACKGSSPKPVWQSFIVLGSGSVGLAILSMILATLVTPQNITHIRGDDVSTSAKVLNLQRKQHCQISNQLYQPGDTAIALPFANQPEKTSETTLSNSLSLLSQCHKDELSPTTIGQEAGTSLILALTKIQTIIANKRALGSHQPFVVTLTLQATEPGKHQPNPNNFQQIKSLVESITRDKSVIAIAGPMGKLQNNLEIALQGLPNQRICPANSIMTCVEWAFERGRKL